MATDVGGLSWAVVGSDSGVGKLSGFLPITRFRSIPPYDRRVQIDLSQGIIEAEGTEEFLLEIYRDFRDGISGSFRVAVDSEESGDEGEEEEQQEEDQEEAPTKAGRTGVRLPRERERTSRARRCW